MQSFGSSAASSSALSSAPTSSPAKVIKEKSRDIAEACSLHSNTHLKMAIVGYPNAGKSSLFNALIGRENDSVVGRTLYSTTDLFIRTRPYHEDERFHWLTEHFPPQRQSMQTLTFVDTVAIVAGAHYGKGRGYESLRKLHSADVLLHVLRAFQDDDITHHNGVIDPCADMRALEHELMVRDMVSVENRLALLEKLLDQGEPTREESFEFNTLLKVWMTLSGRSRRPGGEKPKQPKKAKKMKPLDGSGQPTELKEKEDAEALVWVRVCDGVPLRLQTWTTLELDIILPYRFLTAKKVVYVVNMSTRDYLRSENAQTLCRRVAEGAVLMYSGRNIYDDEERVAELIGRSRLSQEEREVMDSFDALGRAQTVGGSISESIDPQQSVNSVGDLTVTTDPNPMSVLSAASAKDPVRDIVVEPFSADFQLRLLRITAEGNHALQTIRLCKYDGI